MIIQSNPISFLCPPHSDAQVDVHLTALRNRRLMAITCPQSSRPAALQAFVAFSEASGAAASKAAIHGRMFAGVSLQVNFVTQEYFTSVAGAV